MRWPGSAAAIWRRPCRRAGVMRSPAWRRRSSCSATMPWRSIGNAGRPSGGGDLAATERRTAMLDLATRLEKRVGDVVHAVTGSSDLLQREAADMAARTQQTRTEAMAVTEASEQASRNVGQVADATEELAASTGEIARQVQASSGIAGQGVAAAARTDQTVRSMAEAAHRIGEVIQVIESIAAQT